MSKFIETRAEVVDSGFIKYMDDHYIEKFRKVLVLRSFFTDIFDKMEAIDEELGGIGGIVWKVIMSFKTKGIITRYGKNLFYSVDSGDMLWSASVEVSDRVKDNEIIFIYNYIGDSGGENRLSII